MFGTHNDISSVKIITYIMKKLFIPSLILLASVRIGAQEPMTLRDCMEFAVSNSTQVRIQQTQTGDARLDRRNAILTAFTPSITAGTYAYGNWGRSLDPETNVYVNTTSFNNGWQAQAGITLFDGFSAVNNLKISKTAIAMGLSKETQEEDKVCLATMEAYFNVIYYSQLTDILQKQVDNARNAVHLSERQEELGTKGHADVVQMQADLADKEYELTSASNSFKNAMITLQDVMFWPLDEELIIDTEISSLETPATDYESTDEVIANALTFIPAISIAKGTMDNAARSLNTAKWQFLPKLSLNGGWSTSYYTYPGDATYVTDPYWDQFRNHGGEYLQLSLTIPIFDRLNKHTTMAKKRNDLSRASIQYDKAVRDVETEVLKAVQERDGAEAEMFQAQRRSEVQNEAYNLNARKYEQGLISSIEYNTASGNFLKSEADYLYARLKYQLKKRVVSYYNGTRYLEQ